MIDFSGVKAMTIPEGIVTQIARAVCTNVLPTATDTDGSIYNGTGYMDGYRLNSAGEVKEYENSVLTGFIPVKIGDIIRVKGCEWTAVDNFSCYICCFGSDHGYKDSFNSGGYGNYNDASNMIVTVDGDITTFELESLMSTVAYVRISMKGSGADMILTVNEEIGDPEVLWIKPTAYKNQVSISIDTDGSIFNNIGYMDGYRLSSSGATKVLSGATVSGFIPVQGGDVIRITGVKWFDTSTALHYLCGYTSDFTCIGALTPHNGGYTYGTQIYDSVEGFGNMDAIITLKDLNTLAYIRVSAGTNSDGAARYGKDLIVTVNEEIEV